MDMKKRTGWLIGLIGCVAVCLYGLFRLVTEYPVATTIPVVLAVGGFAGVVACGRALNK